MRLPWCAWQQVAFSADGAQLHLYVNGVEVASTDYSGNMAVPSVQYLSMGAVLSVDYITDPLVPTIGYDPANPDFLNGPLDDVAIWNRGLTAEEVSKVYTQGLAGQPMTSVVVNPPAADPTISTTRNADGTITIVYTDLLYSSETLNGTYVPVPAATSPFVVNPGTSGKPSVYYKSGR